MLPSRDYAPGRLALALALLLSACQNAGSDLGFSALATGTVTVGVVLDRDGSHTLTPIIDTAYAHARVALLAKGSTDTVRVLNTDLQGIAKFETLPIGEYRVTVVPSSIGDSLVVAKIDSSEVRLTAGEPDQVVIVRLGYPEVSIRQARALPFGKRAFIRGVVLAGVQSFRDTTSHVQDSSGQIRLTRVQLRAGLTGNAPGDSVSVLGTASVRDGQPTLDLALVSRFGSRPPPTPFFVSTANAATANGGVLDAALVRVTGAIISDTATVAPDFRITASDGSGPLNIILDATLPFSRTVFRPTVGGVPGRSINVTGVLVPNGQGGWNLKPRDVSDVVIN
jgi:hypothetical protein